MAVFNESLAGRFNRIIQRLHVTKGPPPAPQIAPEIGHNVIMENDRPEHHYLAGGTLWSCGFVIAAVAAQAAGSRLRNPSTSGVLAVLERAVVMLATGDVSLVLDLVATDLGTIFASQPRDGRYINKGTPAPGSALIVSGSAATAVGISNPGISRVPAPVGTTLIPVELVRREVIVPPGTTVEIATPVVNQALYVQYDWRERPIEPSEV